MDSLLGVSAWSTPGRPAGGETRARPDVPPGAPAWWHGDEEASQSFLREMGVE